MDSRVLNRKKNCINDIYILVLRIVFQNLYSNMMPRLNVSLKSNGLQNMLLFILWTKGGYSSCTNDEYWWFYKVSFRFYSIKKETKSSLHKTRQRVDYSFIMSRGAMSIQVTTSFFIHLKHSLNYRSEISKFDDIAVLIQDFVS